MKFVATSPVTLLEALRSLYPDSSRRTLQNWLKAGRFTLNGKTVQKENTTLEPGQTLASQENFRPPRMESIPVLFEDRYLIAIDKPVGLLSVPLDEGESRQHALGKVRDAFETEQIFPVHRIDRETSGVLLFARGKQSTEKFNEMFEAHDLERCYFAIVEGHLKEDQGTWECPLLELPSFRVIESEEGKMATTHFEVYRRSAKYTYLKLRLETGKKHQIRVHCQRAGHPVVGDARYGSTENPARRLFLHAKSIGFVHPFTKKKIHIESPLPRSFEVLGGQVKV
jgi:tRNA pseudouridine32 synthase/23S rRNA pseudouridine746 synthase/23S rRNA pseudouridine1911/1915/1917 synthase